MKRFLLVISIAMPMQAGFDYKTIHEIGDWCAIGGSSLLLISSFVIWRKKKKIRDASRQNSVVSSYFVASSSCTSDSSPNSEDGFSPQEDGYSPRFKDLWDLFGGSSSSNSLNDRLLADMESSDDEEGQSQTRKLLRFSRANGLKYWKYIRRGSFVALGCGGLILGLTNLLHDELSADI